MKDTPIITTTERGWAGHYILGHRCYYHRNTLIQSSDGQQFVVSTVGNLHTEHGKPIEPIGADNRYYETMVFKAHQEGPYLDANVHHEIPMHDGICVDNIADMPKDIDLAADRMHESMIKQVCDELMAGNTLRSYTDEMRDWEDK